MKKGLEERIDEDVLQWFIYVERMKNESKRVYVGECAGSHSVGRQWIESRMHR